MRRTKCFLSLTVGDWRRSGRQLQQQQLPHEGGGCGAAAGYINHHSGQFAHPGSFTALSGGAAPPVGDVSRINAATTTTTDRLFVPRGLRFAVLQPSEHRWLSLRPPRRPRSRLSRPDTASVQRRRRGRPPHLDDAAAGGDRQTSACFHAASIHCAVLSCCR